MGDSWLHEAVCRQRPKLWVTVGYMKLCRQNLELWPIICSSFTTVTEVTDRSVSSFLSERQNNNLSLCSTAHYSADSATVAPFLYKL